MTSASSPKSETTAAATTGVASPAGVSEEHRQVLKDIYFTPEKPGSFSGIHSLLREANKLLLSMGKPRVPYRSVVHFLKSEPTYTLHKEVKNQKFVTNPVKIGAVFHSCECDLLEYADLVEFSSERYKYVLTVIDVRSRYVWYKFQRTKTSSETAKAFASVLVDIEPNKWEVCRTDAGNEFMGREFQQLCKDRGIKHFRQLSGQHKTPIVDRFHRTLGERVMKAMHHKNSRDFVSIVPQIVESYNNSQHSRLDKKTPRQVMEMRLGAQPMTPVLDGKEKAVVKVGDHVRLLDIKDRMTHSYKGRYTKEVFIVDRVKEKPGFRTQYYLKSLSGEPILGGVYKEELQSINYTPSELSTIEKVLRKKRIKGKLQYFVKWEGYDKSHNSWVPAADLQDI